MGAPGCDDAPLIELEVDGRRQRPVTLVYPYYDNPGFLQEQFDRWSLWEAPLRGLFSLIVVDDGSPNYPVIWVLSRKSCPFARCQAFRIGVDVRWNWLAARNVGAHEAPPGWIALTDMDHVIPESTARVLAHGNHDQNVIYRFSRREHHGAKIHPHPNSWFMTRAMYWKVGGYDERMSGFYGSDSYYRRRCAATAPIRIMTAELERHEHIGDSSTKHYKRKQMQDAQLRQIVRKFPPGSKPKVLSFPYSRVEY